MGMPVGKAGCGEVQKLGDGKTSRGWKETARKTEKPGAG